MGTDPPTAGARLCDGNRRIVGWTVDFDDPVSALAPVDDRVYVGGDGFVAALVPA